MQDTHWGSFPSAEVQSVYSTTPADWAVHRFNNYTTRTPHPYVTLTQINGTLEHWYNGLTYAYVYYKMLIVNISLLLWVGRIYLVSVWQKIFTDGKEILVAVIIYFSRTYAPTKDSQISSATEDIINRWN